MGSRQKANPPSIFPVDGVCGCVYGEGMTTKTRKTITWAVTDYAWWDETRPVEWKGEYDGKVFATIVPRPHWGGFLVMVKNHSLFAKTLENAKRIARPFKVSA